jgi:Holliday junction resolvasome RuvABC endonuclease subunit
MTPARWIIGIDPGTSLGWAVLDDAGAVVSSGVERLAVRSTESPGMRYLRARAHVGRLLDLAGAREVVVGYEEVRRHAGTQAAHVYGGIVSQVLAECAARGIETAGVPVGSVKATATGKGAASKDAMIAAARARWPNVTPATDDEADALWIAETLRRTLGGAP